MLSIRKEGNTPAWGTVYEQYFQEIDKVKGQKGVLSVEKKLFVETNNGTNRQIRPVTPEQPLRIGDKVIVRLTIRTDREMNYVFLKDLRAAASNRPINFRPGIKRRYLVLQIPERRIREFLHQSSARRYVCLGISGLRIP